MKRAILEQIVPIFINLKHKLNKLKSPLSRDLMACLRELMKDYKAQVSVNLLVMFKFIITIFYILYKHKHNGCLIKPNRF